MQHKAVLVALTISQSDVWKRFKNCLLMPCDAPYVQTHVLREPTVSACCGPRDYFWTCKIVLVNYAAIYHANKWCITECSHAAHWLAPWQPHSSIPALAGRWAW
eukprot:101406-Chlamydomonas_euryale.AAC.10